MTNLELCLAYLAKLPGAVSGSGGHSATLRAACECIRFGLTDGEAMTALAEYNRRCSPPWSERELAHKIADARKKAGTQSGTRGERRPGRRSAVRTFDHAAVDRHLAELRSRPVASIETTAKAEGSAPVAINLDTDPSPAAEAMAAALTAAERHPDYRPGVPIMRQAEEVESIYWATVWARLGVPDPGLMTVSSSPEDCHNLPERAEVPHA